MDYDGTLTRTHKLPEFAEPSPAVLNIIRRLCSVPRTLVYIVSGRDRANLDRWFLVRRPHRSTAPAWGGGERSAADVGGRVRHRAGAAECSKRALA